MRFEFSPQVAAPAIHRAGIEVGADYAPRVREGERRRRRREAVWAALSFVALVLCWDLSARLDRDIFGHATASTVDRHETVGTWTELRSPRRLRKLNEVAEAWKSPEDRR